MFLYWGGFWTSPHLYAPICLYTPNIFICPQGCTHHPMGPHALLCTCMVLEHLHVVGVVLCLNVCWNTPPLFGGAFPLITPPTLCCWFPVHCYSQGYQYLMWAFPLLLKGFGGVPHHLGRFGGHISSSAVHMLILICNLVISHAQD